MSLMISSSAFPLRLMLSASSRWRVSSRDICSNSVMPNTPFIGVRISWLIVARKSLLARLAASAARSAAEERSPKKRITASKGAKMHPASRARLDARHGASTVDCRQGVTLRRQT